jgi:endonuclease YncB( thermonuclease family)
VIAALAAILLTGCHASDGDTLNCAGVGRVRLLGIDAPEMGPCRPKGRICVEGDPFASRDNLQRLVEGRRVTIQIVSRDKYGRPVGPIWADGMNVACAQLRGGYAEYKSKWDNGRRTARACRPFGANIRDAFDDIPSTPAPGSGR